MSYEVNPNQQERRETDRRMDGSPERRLSVDETVVSMFQEYQVIEERIGDDRRSILDRRSD